MSERTSKIIHVFFGLTILAVSFVLISRILDMFLGNKVNDEVIASNPGLNLNVGSTSKAN